MRPFIERKSERYSLTVDATVQLAAGPSESATLLDISAEGCSLQLYTNFIERDRTVLVQVEGLEPLVGRVRWATRLQAGIEFERPLHIAVVEHVVRNNPKIRCGKMA